jgi:hypothetical protein
MNIHGMLILNFILTCIIGSLVFNNERGKVEIVFSTDQGNSMCPVRNE